MPDSIIRAMADTGSVVTSAALVFASTMMSMAGSKFINPGGRFACRKLWGLR